MTTHSKTPETLLAERIGLDPETVGPGAIARALKARMSALDLDDRDAYLRRLAHSEDEQQELVEEVVIPESWFFRDDRPFGALRAFVSARRGDAAAGVGGDGATWPPLRFLSVPCACGEEPYSIAIALLDLGLGPRRFEVDAVDISARHLAMAERGVYRVNSFRGGDLSFRDRHFRPSDAPGGPGFTLDPKVRALVRFTRGNLLDPHLLAGRPPYDVIFCRNLLIYLDAASRRRAFDTIDRLLGRDGLVFVGHAERLAVDDRRFVPWGENASFALRRAPAAGGCGPTGHPHLPLGEAGKGAGRARRAVPPQPHTPRAPEVAGAHDAPRRPATRSAVRPVLAGGDVDPATAAVGTSPTPGPARADADRGHLPETSTTLLAEAAALADRGDHDGAAARCEAALKRFGPNARAYFLLGLVRQAAGRHADAEAFFRKTIYLDPGHDEALLALALISLRRGDADAAAGYRRRAERARAKKGTS